MAWVKGQPEPGIKAKELDDLIRTNNTALEAAISQDHDFITGGTQTGKHNVITMQEQSTPGATAGSGNLATVDSGTQPELEFTSEDGLAVTLTADGAINNQFTDMSQVAIDEDTMVSDSETHFPTQQSVKAYVDTSSPSGMVSAYAGAISPNGWFICDGTEKSEATYSDLFTAIGTTYNDSPSAGNFNIPDLRGYFVRGLSTDNTVDPDARALGDVQLDSIKAHTHGLGTLAVTEGTESDVNRIVGGGASTTTSSTGGDETRPVNKALNYIIKI